MNHLRHSLPVLLSLVACGADPATPAPTATAATDAGSIVPSPDGAAPAPKDAGSDARVLGPAVPVTPDKLGCSGNVRIDGAAIDASDVFTMAGVHDRALVSFTDGTFGTTALANTVATKRLGERLEDLTTYPIARLNLPEPGVLGTTTHFRDGTSIGIVLAGRTSGTTTRHVASIFGYDFETQQTIEERYDSTVNGMAVSAWSTTAGETESYLWARLGDGSPARAWRRTLRAGASWQRTDLTNVPVSQWTEGGKTHVLHAGNREAVVATDGTVESDVALDTVPNTTDPCAYSTVFRGGSGIVTVRSVTRLPCSDPASSAAPAELWMHALGDSTGRKLGERNKPDSALIFMLGAKSDAFVVAEGTTSVTARLQRLDATMGNLGAPVEVTRPVLPKRSALVPIAGGYFWFFEETTAGSTLTTAYRLVCAP